jgi:hypothetical protein
METRVRGRPRKCVSQLLRDLTFVDYEECRLGVDLVRTDVSEDVTSIFRAEKSAS